MSYDLAAIASRNDSYAIPGSFTHNHPSGDPQPSEDDIRITRRLKEVGELMGIEVLHHIIVGGNSHLSFKSKGLL